MACYCRVRSKHLEEPHASSEQMTGDFISVALSIIKLAPITLITNMEVGWPIQVWIKGKMS